MKYVTDTENDHKNGIPETGEWMFSPEPAGYTICFVNDTGFLKEDDRVVVHCRIGDQKPSETNPGMYTSEVHLLGLTSIHECQPTGGIPLDEEAKNFYTSLTERITQAIDGWEEEVSPEDKDKIFSAASVVRRKDPVMDLINSMLNELGAKN